MIAVRARLAGALDDRLHHLSWRGRLPFSEGPHVEEMKSLTCASVEILGKCPGESPELLLHHPRSCRALGIVSVAACLKSREPSTGTLKGSQTRQTAPRQVREQGVSDSLGFACCTESRQTFQQAGPKLNPQLREPPSYPRFPPKCHGPCGVELTFFHVFSFILQKSLGDEATRPRIFEISTER